MIDDRLALEGAVEAGENPGVGAHAREDVGEGLGLGGGSSVAVAHGWARPENGIEQAGDRIDAGADLCLLGSADRPGGRKRREELADSAVPHVNAAGSGIE